MAMFRRLRSGKGKSERVASREACKCERGCDLSGKHKFAWLAEAHGCAGVDDNCDVCVRLRLKSAHEVCAGTRRTGYAGVGRVRAYLVFTVAGTHSLDPRRPFAQG